MKLLNYTLEEVVEILEGSRSFRSGIEKLGYATNGSAAYKQAKLELTAFGVNLETISYQGKGNQGYTTPQLIENSPTARCVVRRYIIRLNLLEEVCASCSITDNWNGKPLSLHLEHRNGVATDHRLDNLEWLCPNCHSQTDSYAGRNKKHA